MSVLARPDITREVPKAFWLLFQIRPGRSEILSKQGISIRRRFCQCNVRIGWTACKMLFQAVYLELRCLHDLVLRLLLKSRCHRRIRQSVCVYRGCIGWTPRPGAGKWRVVFLARVPWPGPWQVLEEALLAAPLEEALSAQT